jgi:hypothetical protein
MTKLSAPMCVRRRLEDVRAHTLLALRAPEPGPTARLRRCGHFRAALGRLDELGALVGPKTIADARRSLALVAARASHRDNPEPLLDAWIVRMLGAMALPRATFPEGA